MVAVVECSRRPRRCSGAVVFHQQVEREILDEEFGVVLQRLAVQRVQDGVAGAVGRRTGALHRRPPRRNSACGRRRAAGRCGHPRCARTARRNARARRPPSALPWSGTAWRRHRRASPDPLTVSYMCHCHESGVMLVSDAAMPPWAATVCERVGNTLEMQAVLKPCSAMPSVARSPAPPAPTTTTS